MECYYAWSMDYQALLNSSSGGIFTSLAQKVLEDSGTVFGVILDYDTSIAHHIKIDNLSDLTYIRKSKYQQSVVGNVYNDVAQELRMSKVVLYTGTPCQVAGLLSLLNQKKVNTKNLLTMEILCHGVTNTYLINAYLTSMEKKYQKAIKRYEFRTKELPWYHSGSSVHLMFEDGTEVYRNNAIDEFYIAFKRSLILRPSCYHCAFTKKEGRLADYTVGDFWGAEDYIKNKRALNQGISIVLTNTEKGERSWQELIQNKSVKAEKLDFDIPIRRNAALVKPASFNTKRDEFFKRIKSEDFSKIIKDMCRKSIVKGHFELLIGYDMCRKLKKIKNMERK